MIGRGGQASIALLALLVPVCGMLVAVLGYASSSAVSYRRWDHTDRRIWAARSGIEYARWLLGRDPEATNPGGAVLHRREMVPGLQGASAAVDLFLTNPAASVELSGARRVPEGSLFAVAALGLDARGRPVQLGEMVLDWEARGEGALELLSDVEVFRAVKPGGLELRVLRGIGHAGREMALHGELHLEVSPWQAEDGIWLTPPGGLIAVGRPQPVVAYHAGSQNSYQLQWRVEGAPCEVTHTGYGIVVRALQAGPVSVEVAAGDGSYSARAELTAVWPERLVRVVSSSGAISIEERLRASGGRVETVR